MNEDATRTGAGQPHVVGILPVPAVLSAVQADGLACVYCGRDYLADPVARVPVGRSRTGSQVFACSAGGRQTCGLAPSAGGLAAVASSARWIPAADKVALLLPVAEGTLAGYDQAAAAGLGGNEPANRSAAYHGRALAYILARLCDCDDIIPVRGDDPVILDVVSRLGTIRSVLAEFVAADDSGLFDTPTAIRPIWAGRLAECLRAVLIEWNAR